MKVKSFDFSSAKTVRIESEDGKGLDLVFRFKSVKDEQFELEKIAKDYEGKEDALREKYHAYISGRLEELKGDPLLQDGAPITVKDIKDRKVIGDILNLVYAAFNSLINSGKVDDEKKDESSSASSG